MIPAPQRCDIYDHVRIYLRQRTVAPIFRNHEQNEFTHTLDR